MAGRPLKDLVRERLLAAIIRGDYPPGARLVEADLATALGVSRTPIREALQDLARVGVVRGALARGYSVEPLTGREIGEVYPILVWLEELGLRLAWPRLTPDVVAELEQVNLAMARAPHGEERLRLDNRFHSVLAGASGNRRLVAMLEDLKAVIRRYEYAYWSHDAWLERSVGQHTHLLERIRAGDPDGAAATLAGNWRDGLAALQSLFPGARPG